MNPLCAYFGVADPTIHALVSNGRRGINQDIPYFKCQACGWCKSSRLNNPMYHLKTPLHRVAMVMHALSEGLDISAASRIFNHPHSTVSRWLERGGQHSAWLHERLQYAQLCKLRRGRKVIFLYSIVRVTSSERCCWGWRSLAWCRPRMWNGPT